MQRRRPVQQHGAVLCHFINHLAHFGCVAIHQALCTLYVGAKVVLHQLGNDEWTEQLFRHHIWQAALVQLELGAHHNHRAPGVINALAQQVAAEAALLALQHVAQ